MIFILHCLNSLYPVVPADAVEQWKDWRPLSKIPGTLHLPLEMILMILEYASSKTLANFFCASAMTLSFAPLYCGLHRWRLFPPIY